MMSSPEITPTQPQTLFKIAPLPCDDPDEKELQEGTTLNDLSLQKVSQSIQHILESHEDQDTTRLQGQTKHLIFTLKTVPGFVFKMDRKPQKDTMKARYANIKKAYQVVKAHRLGLLLIPHVSQYTVQTTSGPRRLLVEQTLNMDPHTLAQDSENQEEENFETQAPHLTEAIRQLACLICKTGYSDVAWRNLPLVKDSGDEKGNRRVALIDLEEMDDPTTGLFGGFMRRGLVGCVTEDQAHLVKEVAEQEKINTQKFDDAFSKRKKEIAERRALQTFYETRHIRTGLEPLSIDEKALDFSEYPQEKEAMKQFAMKLIPILNETLNAASPSAPLSKKRLLCLSIRALPEEILKQARKLVDIPQEKIPELLQKERETFDYSRATFLGRVIQKLIDWNVLFGISNIDGSYWYLQA